ncbi:PadR family transcriptional regulator [Cytobacillus purgationiresistens]|uniref:DNA-binding PadR family transcriptional regulator n=1 Tax=Cytobacillus purgationiresistens TaxID=863449 RepID=A0ABU0AIY6_9BACI|nr:PadR family transcriptional regulator [Cytobacillus purgationiresistens]MDQ0270393.1 DNA-binding PadR family transcriptional regulator [Cytobacillus purgationiresistens]
MIRIYILGMLAQTVNYPYMIRKRLLEVQPYTSLSEGKFYYDFESLRKKQYIETVETIQEEKRPDKTMYTITNLGRDYLEEELYKCFKKNSELEDLYIAINFLDYIDTKKAGLIFEDTIQKEKKRWKKFEEKKKILLSGEKSSNTTQFITDHAFNKAYFNIEWMEKLLAFIKKY